MMQFLKKFWRAKLLSVVVTVFATAGILPALPSPAWSGDSTTATAEDEYAAALLYLNAIAPEPAPNPVKPPPIVLRQEVVIRVPAEGIGGAVTGAPPPPQQEIPRPAAVAPRQPASVPSSSQRNNSPAPRAPSASQPAPAAPPPADPKPAPAPQQPTKSKAS